MTTRLIDLASYQEGIHLPTVWNAGFRWVNIKTSEGISYKWAARKAYADEARRLGFGISSFHYLRNGRGVEQARIAFAEMNYIGATVHQCDDESDADWQTTRDYINTFQDLLGRHLIFYTGDWWLKPKGWSVAALTPYLWAAPNRGYLGSYPGDESPDWTAGYGGFATLSAMQYAVKEIPNAGGGKLSMTAFNDIALGALSGGSVSTLDNDDINRIVTALLERPVGKSGNQRPLHFLITDIYDQIVTGASQYDGQRYFIGNAITEVKNSVLSVLSALDGTAVEIQMDADAIATAVADKIFERMQS